MSAVCVSAGAQSLLVTPPVVHHAAHSECPGLAGYFSPLHLVSIMFLLLSQGTVLTPGLEHTMSIQPTSMMGPLTQQLSHLSMGSSGTVSRTEQL